MNAAKKLDPHFMMAAVCNCCGRHAHEYPFEIFQVCAVCGRGTYVAKRVRRQNHVRDLRVGVHRG